MLKEICTFQGIEGAGNQADSATESFDCSLGRLAQLRFNFAEALFDRIEVRRILRQISQMRPHRFDGLIRYKARSLNINLARVANGRKAKRK